MTALSNRSVWSDDGAMNGWKISTFVFAGFAAVAVSMKLGSTFDAAATQKYREQLLFEFAGNIRTLSKVCERHINGMNKSEVLDLLRELEPDVEPFEKDEYVVGGGLMIQLSEGGVAEHCVVDALLEEWDR
ncbi:MAG: hypothetical protein AAFP04_06605 [Myxococcota bacterium]